MILFTNKITTIKHIVRMYSDIFNLIVNESKRNDYDRIYIIDSDALFP